MTKRDFVNGLIDRYAISKEDAEKITDLVFSEIHRQLALGKEVRITGVGTFRFKYYPPRTVNNNLRGERHAVGPRVKLRFRSHPSMRRDLRELAKEISYAKEDQE